MANETRKGHPKTGRHDEAKAEAAEIATPTKFTWVPIYIELAKKILPYRERQGELISVLKELKAHGRPIVLSADYDEQESEIPLGVIDPFTFFACFNTGIKIDHRQNILAYLKTRFELQSAVPTDFVGVPIVYIQNAWFFPYASEREADDIPSLWTLADAVVKNPPEKLDTRLFERCLKIKTVGPAKLTMGMFWLNPKHYLAWDAKNRNLFELNGINDKIENMSTYLQLIRNVNAKFGTDYPQISLTAFELKIGRQYWAGGFQWGDTSKLEEFMRGNFWQIGYKKQNTKRAAKKTWNYFEQVKVGDQFAIKGYGGRNDLLIHYIGEVTSKTDDGILELRKVDQRLYRGKGPTGLTGATWFDTLVPIKSPSIIDIIFHGEEKHGEHGKEACAMNLILYGPPGTGKTYQAIERAVKAVDPGFIGDHFTHKRKFDELARQGRIGFITFHQSYSYEDFVEGIRPVLDADEEDDVPRYECRAGVFKRIAVDALFDCLETALVTTNLVPFDVLWKALLTKIESEPEAKYPGLTDKSSYQLVVTPRGNLEGGNVVSGKNFFCSRKILEQVFEAKRDRDSVTVSDVMEVVSRGCHAHLVSAVFNELKKIEKSQFHGDVKHRRQTIYTAEERAEMVQRFLGEGERSGYQLKPEAQWKRYVVVIDEINRGNVSKILGELITLIETDKRLRNGDHQNSLVVTLPYSGEKFAVPANLCLLATMNTADKSIALVDIALRRRFDFEELRVDLSVCEELTNEMRAALQELNRRIFLRKDRDHQIGHAYFVSVTDEESFNQRFRKQIIPLLQEYFYNDWEGLRYVLGDNSTSDGIFIRKVSRSDDREARTKWQWFFDAGVEDLNCLRTLLSNYQTPTRP